MKLLAELDVTRADFYARDELETGRRTMLEADEDGLGAWLTIIDTARAYRRVHLDLFDVEALADKLAGIAERGWRDVCPWCDSRGLVDGPDGPESCDHHLVDA